MALSLWQRTFPAVAWRHHHLAASAPTARACEIPEEEWVTVDGPRLVWLSTGAAAVAGDWRPFLFAHLSPAKMCLELADLLWGDAGLALGRAFDPSSPAALLAFFSAESFVEATRRALVLRDRHRTGVARADAAQVRLIAAALLRDVGCHWDGGAAARLVPEILAGVVALQRCEALPPCSPPPVAAPEPIAAPWAALLDAHTPLVKAPAAATGLPVWYATAMTAQSVALRAAAASGALGFHSDLRTTRSGTWHSFRVPAASAAMARHPPIVLVHGLFTHAPSMLPLALVLAAHTGRATIAPDLLDFDFGYSRTRARCVGGGEAAAASGALSLGLLDYVDALEEFLDSVARESSSSASASSGEAGSCRRVDLVGHSFGGWTSHRLAARRPDLVRRLVLLSPGGGGRYRFAPAIAMLAGPGLTSRVLETHLPAAFASLVAHVVDVIVHSPFHAHILGTMGYDSYAAPPLGPPVSAPTLVAWGTDDTLHRPWVRGARGEAGVVAEQLLQPAEAELLRGCGAGARGVWLVGGSHAINVDSLVALRRCITGFLLDETTDVEKGLSHREGAKAEAGLGREGDAHLRPPPPRLMLEVVCRVLERISTAAGGDRRVVAMEPLAAAARVELMAPRL